MAEQVKAMVEAKKARKSTTAATRSAKAAPIKITPPSLLGADDNTSSSRTAAKRKTGVYSAPTEPRSKADIKKIEVLEHELRVAQANLRRALKQISDSEKTIERMKSSARRLQDKTLGSIADQRTAEAEKRRNLKAEHRKEIAELKRNQRESEKSIRSTLSSELKFLRNKYAELASENAQLKKKLEQ